MGAPILARFLREEVCPEPVAGREDFPYESADVPEARRPPEIPPRPLLHKQTKPAAVRAASLDKSTQPRKSLLQFACATVRPQSPPQRPRAATRTNSVDRASPTLAAN